jgi:cytochrome c peroxidase
VLGLLTGCGGSPEDAEAPPAGLGASEWETLKGLAPAELPPAVSDPSNAWADDPLAARLGEKLFFDAGFSGKLLDLDNDGAATSLGVIGQSGKVACSGCHMKEAAFLDTRSLFKEISLGTGWTERRTPSLFDIGQASIVMWGGGRSTLYSQVFGPVENPLEMNSSRLFFAQWIHQNYRAEYESVFGAGALAPIADAARFPPLTPDTTGCKLTQDVDHPREQPPHEIYECHGIPGDGAEYDGMAPTDQELVTRVVVNAGKAVAAYERLLVCGQSRFDAWVQGDATALSEAEQRGAKLFVGKAKCVNCHFGPYLSDQKFHNLGLEEKETQSKIFNGNDRGAARDLVTALSDPVGIHTQYSDGDDGRMPKEIPPEYEGAFRTPTLRCVSQRPSFMHHGLLKSLEDVVRFFNRGGDPAGTYVGVSVLEPLGLTTEEEADLVAFLRSLDGNAAIPTFL